MNYAYQIKQSVSLRDACDRYGIDVNRHGFARCPFHEERTASLKIYPDNTYHCFGCGAHGSGVIDFVMSLFHLDFRSACSKLNEDFGLYLPLDHEPTLREQREFERKANERKAQLDAIRAKREALETAYYKALDEYVRLDTQKRIYEPQETDTELHPKYVEALQKIAIADYFLEVAEDELYEFKRRNNH